MQVLLSEIRIGFDWSQLPQDALLVDVGGGNGSESFEIAKKASHIKIIVQDREETIKQVTTPVPRFFPSIGSVVLI
jgi:precorrin-6B methylase 2